MVIITVYLYIKKKSILINFNYLDVKMRTTSASTSNQQNSVVPYKDYPASNSSTKSQTQLVCFTTIIWN